MFFKNHNCVYVTLKRNKKVELAQACVLFLQEMDEMAPKIVERTNVVEEERDYWKKLAGSYHQVLEAQNELQFHEFFTLNKRKIEYIR